MNVTIIGSGNVAGYLALKLKTNSHHIDQIYSRNKNTGPALAKKIKCRFVAKIKNLTNSSDIYIICVNDDEIQNVAKEIRVKNKLIIHTSGSTPLNVLKNCSKKIGVIYPLIIIAKPFNNIPENYPVCIEGKTAGSLKACKEIAQGLSNQIVKIDSNAREILHLAAVIVNNFTNHLYTQADKLLLDNKLDFKLLGPIIKQTATGINKVKPILSQTGPAIRGDKKIINKHLKLIRDNKQLTSIYKSFSKSIFELYKKK